MSPLSGCVAPRARSIVIGQNLRKWNPRSWSLRNLILKECRSLRDSNPKQIIDVEHDDPSSCSCQHYSYFYSYSYSIVDRNGLISWTRTDEEYPCNKWLPKLSCSCSCRRPECIIEEETSYISENINVISQSCHSLWTAHLIAIEAMNCNNCIAEALERDKAIPFRCSLALLGMKLNASSAQLANLRE